MSERWRKLLLNYEKRMNLIAETHKAVNEVVHELEVYLNDQSNIGKVPVRVEKIGELADAEWVISIQDFTTTIDIDDIKSERSTSGRDGFPIEDSNKTVKEAVENLIERRFTFGY